jgi:hypothetical protein
MKNSALVLLLTTFSLTMTEAANAAFFEQQDVFCGGENCGTMQINTYAPFENTESGGVTIEGLFQPVDSLGSSNFHYIQAVTVDDFPPPFIDGKVPLVPYIDPPPDGYKDFIQFDIDLLPYYDQKDVNKFPKFFDRPFNPLSASSKPPDNTGSDGKLDVKFETWLVSVLDETFGTNPNKAQDDFFTVSPLIGWTWGFSIKDADDDKLNPNFTTRKNPFNWLTGTPSADWNTALGQIYGTGSTQDRFNVAVVPNTPPTATTPEPTSILMFLGMGAVGAASLLKRKQNQDA